jgi:hypothetical protein
VPAGGTPIGFNVGGIMLGRFSRGSSATGSIRVAAATLALLAALAGATTALASSVATYKGAGKGALKDTVTIKASSSKVVSYKLSVETLCGKVNLGGDRTVVWPVTPNAGEAPLKVKGNGAFSGKQHESTTIPPISGVTTEAAPGTYTFSITGRFNSSRSKVEGHVSLQIETSTGYFCTATNSPFTAKKK